MDLNTFVLVFILLVIIIIVIIIRVYFFFRLLVPLACQPFENGEDVDDIGA